MKDASDSTGEKFDRAALRALLISDLHAHGVERWSFDLRYRNPSLRYQRSLRRVEYWRAQRGPLARVMRGIYRFQLQRLSVLTGLSIPPGVFGPELYIAHYGSIVINSGVRVGARCQIHSATNIGVGADGRVPVIGDDVYIGPGAVLYGGIQVGSGSAIGANAVVNADVPAGTTVAGVPAKVISRRGSASLRPPWSQA